MGKDVIGSRITQAQGSPDTPEAEEDRGSARIHKVLEKLVAQIRERLKQAESDFAVLDDQNGFRAHTCHQDLISDVGIISLRLVNYGQVPKV